MDKAKQEKKFMRMAIALSQQNVEKGLGGPFGAVIVKDGKVLARSANRVTTTNDPTAHAEVAVIRLASKKLKSFDLTGCEIYTSCEPCPMCLGAIYWSRISKVYYANTKDDAAAIGFDDKFIYNELDLQPDDRKLPATQLLREEAIKTFEHWQESESKIQY
ncbi:nucleoside deaminase [Paradesertivirga mongoliensis]|uniref:Nucleoside deaminase n=1 Tax=Paradesertivirga mongoliensis TaxID=2100740 RepID=A0ABW4ZKF9_9SPHI|nr:nucleoside deaminase [Pedobacter mongoliensis]